MSAKASIERHSRSGKLKLVSPLGLVLTVISVAALSFGAQPTLGQADCVNIGNACPVDPPACAQEPCCPQQPCVPPESVCCPCEGVAVFPDGTNPLVPLNDLCDPSFRYLGTHALGLYVDDIANPTVQTNDITEIGTHYTDGLAQGATVAPRDANGLVEHDTGKIGLVSVGFSNPNQEWQDLIDDQIITLDSPGFDGLNDKLVFVNGAQAGFGMCAWEVVPDLLDPSNIWRRLVDNELPLGKAVGQNDGSFTAVTREQVQVVWIKLVMAYPWKYCNEVPNTCGCPPAGTECAAPCWPPGNPVDCGCDDDVGGCCAYNLCGDPACRFPHWMEHSTDGEIAKYKTILQHIRTVFPNVAQVFISSRMYAGYSNEVDASSDLSLVPAPCDIGSPEPWAYENGFTVQGVIRAQAFDGGMDFGPAGVYPYVAWAPYFWSNGTEANPDGLTWECWQVCADGSHPSRDEDVDEGAGEVSGQSQVADLLFDFFKTHPLAKQWYLEAPLIMFSDQEDGFIDPLEDRDGETGLIPQGLTTVTVEFDNPVQDATTYSSLTPGTFEITSTGGKPPTVQSVTDQGNDRYLLTFSGPIEPGEWTTVIAHVADMDGHNVRSDPWDRIDLGFLPGDVTGDGTTNTADYTTLVNCLKKPGCPLSAPLERYDIDRDGDVDTADKTRLEELLKGKNTTRVWNNVSLPPKP